MKGLLDEWVVRQAERRPAQQAVVLGRSALTYAQLEDWSNRLARTLQGVGVRHGDRVCLLLPKEPTTIAAILAIIKVGAIYVPLDPESPARRLSLIMASCEPALVLTDAYGIRLVAEIYDRGLTDRPLAVGWLERGLPSLEHQNGYRVVFTMGDVEEQSPRAPAPRRPRSATDTAYIMYTSGSTGTPKGVVVTHANVTHFVSWASRYFGAGPGERHSGHAPLHFDLSTYDIFGTFASGAELYLVPPRLNRFPTELVEFIRAASLTQWFSTPSVLNYLAKFDAVRFHDFPHLKHLLWCGEVLPTPSLIYWMRRLPHVSFTNLYGPTETTIASTFYTVPACPTDERAAVPIGRACPGEEVLVLNDQLAPVPVGEPGELYIAGAGVTRGYWRDEERTREAFVPHPGHENDRLYRTGDLAKVGEDGLIYFLGRADSQIKTRGYRVELGEIEAALQVVPGLQEGAVVALATDRFEGAVICCAFAPRQGAELTAAQVRTQLATMLPTYMLPTRWLTFMTLPRHPNGKVDRQRLIELFAEDAPRPTR